MHKKIYAKIAEMCPCHLVCDNDGLVLQSVMFCYGNKPFNFFYSKLNGLKNVGNNVLKQTSFRTIEHMKKHFPLCYN